MARTCRQQLQLQLRQYGYQTSKCEATKGVKSSRGSCSTHRQRQHRWRCLPQTTTKATGRAVRCYGNFFVVDVPLHLSA